MSMSSEAPSPLPLASVYSSPATLHTPSEAIVAALDSEKAFSLRGKAPTEALNDGLLNETHHLGALMTRYRHLRDTCEPPRNQRIDLIPPAIHTLIELVSPLSFISTRPSQVHFALKVSFSGR